MQIALRFLQAALSKKVTYTLLRPLMRTVLVEVAFPQLCFTSEDAELWEFDPSECVTAAAA